MQLFWVGGGIYSDIGSKWSKKMKSFILLLDYLDFCCSVSKLCQTLLLIPQAVAYQAPLSMGIPRQKYWSGLPFPSPEDLPNPRIEPMFLALAGRFFTTESPEKHLLQLGLVNSELLSPIPYELAYSSFQSCSFPTNSFIIFQRAQTCPHTLNLS